jgi:hypothetical protein
MVSALILAGLVAYLGVREDNGDLVGSTCGPDQNNKKLTPLQRQFS